MFVFLLKKKKIDNVAASLLTSKYCDCKWASVMRWQHQYPGVELSEYCAFSGHCNHFNLTVLDSHTSGPSNSYTQRLRMSGHQHWVFGYIQKLHVCFTSPATSSNQLVSPNYSHISFRSIAWLKLRSTGFTVRFRPEMIIKVHFTSLS